MAIVKEHIYSDDVTVTASNILAFLQAYAAEYFSSFSKTGTDVNCYVGDEIFLTITTAAATMSTVTIHGKYIHNNFSPWTYGYACEGGVSLSNGTGIVLTITKDASGETVAVAAYELKANSAYSNGACNLYAASPSSPQIDEIRVKFHDPPDGLTVLTPFVVPKAMPSHTPSVSILTYSQHVSGTGSAVLDIDGTDYLSNGLWAVKDAANGGSGSADTSIYALRAEVTAEANKRIAADTVLQESVDTIAPGIATVDMAPYPVYSNIRDNLLDGYRAQSIEYNSKDGKWCIVGGSKSADGTSRLFMSSNIYDWSGMETVDFTGYHCNDCAYNPDTNELAVVSGYAGDGVAEIPNIVSIINLNTLDVRYVDITTLGLANCHSIAYHNGGYIVLDQANSVLYRVSAAFDNASRIGSSTKTAVCTAAHLDSARLSRQSGYIMGDVYYQVYSVMQPTNLVAQSGSTFSGAVVAAISLDDAHLIGVSRFDWAYGREVEAAVHVNGRLYWLVDGTYLEVLESQPFAKRSTVPVTIPIPSGADMDTYVSIGTYTCNSASTAGTLKNSPYTKNGFTLEVTQLGSVQVKQTYYPTTITSAEFVERKRGSTAWGAYCKYTGTAL